MVASPDRELLLNCQRALTQYRALLVVELFAGDLVAAADSKIHVYRYQHMLNRLQYPGKQLHLFPPD